jgi:hypothetical protein
MACGALKDDDDGCAHWVAPKRAASFLFPVRALSQVFRGKFLAALQQATQAQALPRDPAQSAQAVRERQRALRKHDWVVYAKTPLAGPAAVLDYLSRYTHRTAIGNERLIAIEGQQVLLRVRANSGAAAPGKGRIAIDGAEFVARLLQHVLPQGFKRNSTLWAAGTGGQERTAGALAPCCACPSPTPKPPRMRRRSCGVWWSSISGTARIAQAGACN